MAKINGTHRPDTLNGTAAGDEIFGGNGNDTLYGNAGDDFLFGENGSDLLSGGAGNDVIDGGNGQDSVLLDGNRADYHFSDGPDGAVIMRDLRAGSPDGTDRLSNMERVRFADGTFKIGDLISANAAPVAGDDAFTLAEDAGATDVTALLLGNDSDLDGDALTITGVGTSASGATVTLHADGTVSYDPAGVFSHLEEGQTATDSFTYTITDAAGLTATATATVTITGAGAEPVPDAFFYVPEDGTNAEMWGSIVESFGFDIVGIEADGLLGTLEYDYEAGLLAFTADHDSSDVLNVDQEQMTYFTVIGDEGERKLIGMVIGGVNDAIVAVDDAVAIGEGATSGNLWPALVGNDVDPDNGVNTRRILSVDSTGTLGTVSLDGLTTTLTYSAAGIELAPGQTITDSFTYTVSDGNGGVDTATVTVTVTGADDGGLAVSAAPAEGAFVAEGEAETLEGAFAVLGFAQPDALLGADLIVA